MRSVIIVAYDICDPKRLHTVHKFVTGFGARMQLSVYRCVLTERDRVLLEGGLHDLIVHSEDRVMFIDLGREKRANRRVRTLGIPFAYCDEIDLVL